MKCAKSFTASIYVGYLETAAGVQRTISVAREVIYEVCDRGGLCVSLTPTEFIYKNGSEHGCIVGMINYPRFPEDAVKLEGRALDLAQKLKDAYRQRRVTIVFADHTIMLEDECAE